MSSGFFSGRHLNFQNWLHSLRNVEILYFFQTSRSTIELGLILNMGTTGEFVLVDIIKCHYVSHAWGEGVRKPGEWSLCLYQLIWTQELRQGRGVGPHNGRLGELCWSRQTWSHPTLCRSSPSGRHTPNKTSLPASLPERHDKIGLAIRWRWSDQKTMIGKGRA